MPHLYPFFWQVPGVRMIQQKVLRSIVRRALSYAEINVVTVRVKMASVSPMAPVAKRMSVPKGSRNVAVLASITRLHITTAVPVVTLATITKSASMAIASSMRARRAWKSVTVLALTKRLMPKIAVPAVTFVAAMPIVPTVPVSAPRDTAIAIAIWPTVAKQPRSNAILSVMMPRRSNATEVPAVTMLPNVAAVPAVVKARRVAAMVSAPTSSRMLQTAALVVTPVPMANRASMVTVNASVRVRLPISVKPSMCA